MLVEVRPHGLAKQTWDSRSEHTRRPSRRVQLLCAPANQIRIQKSGADAIKKFTLSLGIPYLGV